MGVAASQRSASLLPEPPGHRAAAIAGSVALHAFLLGGLILLGRYAAREPEPEPMRLVFVEPAPPPKLGSPDGGARAAAPAAQGPSAQAPEPAPVPPVQRALEAPRPAVAPVEAKPKDRPKPVARAKSAAKPRPAPAPAAAPAPSDAAEGTDAGATGTVAVPRGVHDGHSAGAEGGLAGGQVGGLGSDLTPVRQAAVPPSVLHRVMPAYPESARLRGIEGQVRIEAIIARDGSVEPGVKVVQSIPALDEAAIEAFRRWRFTPARDASGKPLRVILQAPVRFVLR
jgi:protein TonB